MKALVWIGTLAAVALFACATLAGCATLPATGAASQCGNPCATLSCPSAFTCWVDARCDRLVFDGGCCSTEIGAVRSNEHKAQGKPESGAKHKHVITVNGRKYRPFTTL